MVPAQGGIVVAESMVVIEISFHQVVSRLLEEREQWCAVSAVSLIRAAADYDSTSMHQSAGKVFVGVVLLPGFYRRIRVMLSPESGVIMTL